MKSSDINQLLSGNFSVRDLQLTINDEVSTYAILMEKKGSSVPLIFYEDEEIFLNDTNIKILLQETLSGDLSNVHLAYIFDCFTSGEKVRFETEQVKEIIYEIADPEINGGYKSNKQLQDLISNINK